MREEELRKYYEIYTDYWKLFKKYPNPRDDDEFWDSLRKEADEIFNKHKCSYFSQRILLETIEEIDRIGKGK